MSFYKNQTQKSSNGKAAPINQIQRKLKRYTNEKDQILDRN